ncbi:MFS transporter [Phytohabitans kaempferiae]|uniref:MFS transporter n=1 Tax=Phytohabitans kaempferiae TaxID=1620943 RepID=A0ABV6M9V4_9ACTN
MVTGDAARETFDRAKKLALLVLCAQLFLDSMDVSLMGVALPQIQRQLDLPESTLQWLISGYAVAYGGFLLLGGRAADLFGRRRVFLVGTAVFAVASLAGGFLSDGTAIVLTRVIKGIAAAFIAPAALSIITTTFPEGPQRHRAMAVFSLTGASGYSAGLVLSGVLTEASWRLTFLAPVPVALLVLLVTPRVVRGDGPATGQRRGFDLAGAATVTGGLLLFVYALTQAPRIGWLSAGTLLTLFAAVALLAAFVVIERRQASPLVPLGIFRSRTLSSANLIGLVWACATIGWQFVAVLYLQQRLGYGALEAGLAILPMGLSILVVVNFAPRLIARIGLRRLAVLGMLVQGTGILLFLRAGDDSGYLTVLLPALVVHGIGNGLSFPAFNIAGVSGVPDVRQGLAAALITSSVQLGGGLGVAVLAAVLAGAGAGELVGFHRAFLVAGVFSAVGAVIAAVGLRPAAPPVPAEPVVRREPAAG